MHKSHPDACNGLFVADLDGTLLRADGSVGQEDLDALESLARHGVRTAIATGRSLWSFMRSAGATLPVDYVIFTTGAGIVTQPGHRLLYQVNIPFGQVAGTLEFLKKSELDFMLHHAVPDNHRFVYRRANPDNADFETRLARYAEFGQPLDAIACGDFGEAAQFLAIVPRHRTDQALDAVRTGLPGLSIVHSTSPLDHASTWIEFFHPAVSKGQTSAWLASELGVKPRDTMAIGNDYNDLDLLEWAAQAFVVANAPDGLKSRFRQVASNHDGGVAEAVGLWLGEKKLS